MAGVSVDTNPNPGISPEFAAAIDGGENFLKRLGALQQAKKEHDQAFANLNLGMSVVQAQAEVEKKHAIADQHIADAQAKADALVASAQDKANQLLAEAQKQADELKTTAESFRARAAQILEDASKTMNDAQSTQAQAQADAANASALLQQHMKIKADAEALLASAKEKEDKFTSHIGRVKDFIKGFDVE